MAAIVGPLFKRCSIELAYWWCSVTRQREDVMFMSEPAIIDTGSFDDGFEVGWQAVKGTMSLAPLAPLPPLTPLNSTDFLLGVRKGVEKALGKTFGEIR